MQVRDTAVDGLDWTERQERAGEGRQGRRGDGGFLRQPGQGLAPEGVGWEVGTHVSRQGRALLQKATKAKKEA